MTRHSEDSAFNPLAARFWQVEITDNDGDVQTYNFAALSAWDVVQHVDGVMLRDGDFYGHKRRDAIAVNIAETIAPPDSDAFYTISGTTLL